MTLKLSILPNHAEHSKKLALYHTLPSFILMMNVYFLPIIVFEKLELELETYFYDLKVMAKV